MPDLDRPALLGGLRRHARTAMVAGGLAARLAAQRLGAGRGLSESHARDLLPVLGALKGPLVKIAQFLAAIPGFLPEGYARELQKLQSQAPSMGPAFVRRRMKGELGPDWRSLFAEFDMRAKSAASLGQVHEGVLADGMRVACKLQYPAMQSAIEADLRQLKGALSVYETFGNAIRQGEVFKEISERLREELDYRREARNLRLYARVLADAGVNVKVPRPCDAPQTDKLLAMEWVEGLSFDRFVGINPSQEARNRAARALFLAWYVPFYRYGIVHGDPHPGNFLFNERGDLTLLDLGSVRIFRPRFVGGVMALHRLLKEGRSEAAARAYEDWGFERLTPPVVDALNQWAMFFFKPLLHEGVGKLEGLSDFKEAQKILGEVHAALKKAGGVTLPCEFVLLDRSAIGLGSAFLRLNAELDWSRLFAEAVGPGFSPDRVAQAQKALLESVGVDEKGDARGE